MEEVLRIIVIVSGVWTLIIVCTVGVVALILGPLIESKEPEDFIPVRWLAAGLVVSSLLALVGLGILSLLVKP